MSLARTEPLSFLVGPTASGKSALALEVAERIGAEIVSLDSMLVYRGMDVGTAKPDAAARARVPHHVVDLVDPSERYHVQRYLADAGAAIEAIRARDARILFVGGTGLYLKALTHGLFEGPPHDEGLRAELEERWDAEGGEELHAELLRADPRAGERIHPNDRKRVIRGLEVWLASGRTLTAWQAEWGAAGGAPGALARERVPGRVPGRVIVGLEVPAERLDARIAERTRGMLADGWIEETRAVQGGVGFGPTAIQALGYAEVLRHLEGALGRGELEELVRLRTRQLARRQRTWFRGFPEIRWVDPEGPDPAGAILDALDPVR
ncbi:MAG: tRNA (adenosine(37)-N6)-dimethylallyltransferase MiaA [Planctomycetota bacterium]|nr:tRNA (adenosine(37)-N6)-dimethylallyltransferase MiaA [Planctomycetota bacterium]